MTRNGMVTARRICGKGRSARWARWCVFLCLMAEPVMVGPSDAADGLIASPEPGWPQWRGPRRDGLSDETDLLTSWPEGGPPLVWKRDGFGVGWSSPIVAGERLYLTGDLDGELVVFALGLDGAVEWRTTNGRAWRGPYPGARASCVFSEGRLYHLNAHGRLACLDASSGREIWAVNVLDRFEAQNIRWGLSECLLVDGPNVIVTPGGQAALMAAMDKRTGETVWTTEPLGNDDTSYSSPILFRYGGRRLIANCSSAHGFGVDADTGELLWTVPLRNPHGANIAGPIYGDGHIFYATARTEDSRLYRLAVQDDGISAEHRWTTAVDPVTGYALLVDGTLFAARYLEAKWWFGIDWQTGRTTYELEDFTTGAAIHADGRLYIVDEQGTVALVTPEANGLTVVGQFRLTPERIRDAWTHPILHDGRLYLRHHDNLWCYDVRRPK